MSAVNISDKQRAPAVERATAILDLISDTPTPLGVSDIARSLDLPKSSVHGICETLIHVGLLRPSQGGYALGAHVLRWSSAFLSRTSLVQDFQTLLSSEKRLRRYTVTLSTLDGLDVVYLDCHNSDQPLGFSFRAGQKLPAVFAATGKAMLAALPDAERRTKLAETWPAPMTRNSVRDLHTFELNVSRWRTLGYAIDGGEIREGMICYGAAILDLNRRPVAGVAISLTSEEARADTQEKMGHLMAEIAAKLSR